jgi:hypothetical protein
MRARAAEIGVLVAANTAITAFNDEAEAVTASDSIVVMAAPPKPPPGPRIHHSIPEALAPPSTDGRTPSNILAAAKAGQRRYKAYVQI